MTQSLNFKTISIIGAAVLVAVVIMSIFSMNIGAHNREAELRALFEAKQQETKINYDAAWKIIAEVAEVPTQYSQDFKDAYTSIVSSDKGVSTGTVKGLFAVATGMNPPQLDPSLYKAVQNAVISQRTKMANQQAALLDVKREHDKLRTTWPSSMFLGGVKPLEAKTVTSTKTEAAFESGRDDDVGLYKKK